MVWGSWQQGSTTQHSRTRNCSVCSRSQSDSANHSWSAWSNPTTSTHLRSCSTCGRRESGSHTNGARMIDNSQIYSSSDSVGWHAWRCGVCNAMHSRQSHTWGAYQTSATHHWRRCTATACGGQTRNHPHNWTGTGSARRCQNCNRPG